MAHTSEEVEDLCFTLRTGCSHAVFDAIDHIGRQQTLQPEIVNLEPGLCGGPFCRNADGNGFIVRSLLKNYADGLQRIGIAASKASRQMIINGTRMDMASGEGAVGGYVCSRDRLLKVEAQLARHLVNDLLSALAGIGVQIFLPAAHSGNA